MRLDTFAIANATGVVTAALFTLCALLLAVAPAAAYAAFGYLFHVELGGIAYAMTWGVYLGGLIVWVVAMWLVAAALALARKLGFEIDRSAGDGTVRIALEL